MNAVSVYRAVVLGLPEPELRGIAASCRRPAAINGPGGPWRHHRRRYLVVVDAVDVAGHTSDAPLPPSRSSSSWPAALVDGSAPSLRCVMRTAPRATLRHHLRCEHDVRRVRFDCAISRPHSLRGLPSRRWAAPRERCSLVASCGPARVEGLGVRGRGDRAGPDPGLRASLRHPSGAGERVPAGGSSCLI